MNDKSIAEFVSGESYEKKKFPPIKNNCIVRRVSQATTCQGMP